MRCLRCGVCCTQTEMLLSNSDIKRLERKGYEKRQFARFDKAGYAVLRNHKGYCVFYNAVERRCVVYPWRPAGCRVYPVILDEDKGIVVDIICRADETITADEKGLRGRKVLRLLEEIDFEAGQRCAKMAAKK